MKTIDELEGSLIEELIVSKGRLSSCRGDQRDTFSYYKNDSILNIRYTDVVYLLTINEDKERMILSRSLRQGKIEWIFTKYE